jgi:hypothetical protein
MHSHSFILHFITISRAGLVRGWVSGVRRVAQGSGAIIKLCRISSAESPQGGWIWIVGRAWTWGGGHNYEAQIIQYEYMI